MKIGNVNYYFTEMLLVQVDRINLKLALGQATLSQGTDQPFVFLRVSLIVGSNLYLAFCIV